MTANSADYRRLLDLTGRGFVVLGAGLGIGAEFCRALSQCGAELVCVDIDGARARQIADEVKGAPLTADVTDRSALETVFREAQAKLGVIRGVVNVIGVARIKPLTSFTDDELNWQFNIVLRHALLTLQLAGVAMSKGAGQSLLSAPWPETASSLIR